MFERVKHLRIMLRKPLRMCVELHFTQIVFFPMASSVPSEFGRKVKELGFELLEL